MSDLLSKVKLLGDKTPRPEIAAGPSTPGAGRQI
jgi:hypothetical protein